MKPIGPLMIEHRLAERLLAIMRKEHVKISKTGAIDRAFMNACLDFFTIYLDRFHHGKEEDILFKAVGAKDLSPEHRIILNELIQEHGRSRETVRKLQEAVDRSDHDTDTVREITGYMEQLLTWYPVHIQKEDKQFFHPAMKYLSTEEQQSMLEAMHEFDRAFSQHRYADLVKSLEAQQHEQAGPEAA